MMKKTKFKQTEIGMIPEDWDILKLSDLTFKITKGTTPTTFGGEFVEKGINFVKVESLNDDGSVNQKKFRYIDEGTNNLLARSKLQKNDLLYTIAGTIGRVSVVKEDILPANTNQAVAILRPDLSKINLCYLRYALVNPAVKNYLLSKVVHAVQANLSLNEIGNCPVPIPEIKEQSSIAKILSDLDSKIELNQQMNKTLEAIGQAIFKHWFADSDSTDKPMEELGNFIEFVKGKKPNDTSDVIIEGYKKQILIENLNGEKSLYANPDNTVEVNLYDPIMVMDGASSGRIEIGHEGILGSTLAKIIPTNKRLSSLFIYYFLKSKEFDINENTTGTSIPHTDKGKIKKMLLKIQSEEKLKEFDEIAKHILDKSIRNKNEVKSLSQIRDTLLPKLMSGKIRINIEVTK